MMSCKFLPLVLAGFPLIGALPVFLSAALAQEGAPAAQTEQALPAISVETVGLRKLEARVIAAGFVAPLEEVQVQPLIEGQPIEALNADIGDMVEEGAVLAVLSRSTLTLQLSQSRASLASARATVTQAQAQLVEAESAAAEAERSAERTRRLKDQGSATQAASDSANANAIATTARVTVARESLEAARAQVALYEAMLANTELQLTRAEVRAPYAGRIVARNATIGSIATAAAQPMFVIEKDGALELRADVAEGDLLRLAPGQSVTLRGVGGGQRTSGKVRLVEPAIDPMSRMGRVRITPDDTALLRAGMYLEADILTEAREALALPVAALGQSARGPQVYALGAGDLIEARPITTGIRDMGWIEITSGLSAGEKVVAKAAAFVRPGQKILPVAAQAALQE